MAGGRSPSRQGQGCQGHRGQGRQCYALLALVATKGCVLLTVLAVQLGWLEPDALSQPQTYSCDDVISVQGHGQLSFLSRHYEPAACSGIINETARMRRTDGASNMPSPVSIISAVALHVAVCGDQFTYSHFLSVKSATLTFRPNILHLYTQFHYPSQPYYAEWLDDVRRLAVNVIVHEFAVECSRTLHVVDVNKLILIANEHMSATSNSSIMNVFMQANIVFDSQRWLSYCGSGKVLLQPDGPSTRALLFTHKQLPSTTEFKAKFPSVQTFVCSSIAEWSSESAQIQEESAHHFCVVIEANHQLCDVIVEAADNRDKDAVSALLKHVHYGDRGSDVICPIKYEHDVIPRVGHYVWFNRQHMDFSFYLSVLSLLYVVKVNCVIIHGNLSPSGPYWHDLRARACVRWQYWPLVSDVFGTHLHLYVAHKADIVRGETFVRYGGLHADPDLYFVNALPDDIWRYEAVIGLDAFRNAPGLQALPESVGALVNLGACLSMPGSRFFRIYQDTQRSYYDRLWIYNSGIKPSHLYDRYPQFVRLLPNMQTVCNSGKMYPAWPKDEKEFRETVKRPFCVLEQTYSFHFTHPETAEYEDPRRLRVSTSLYARVASLILQKANISLEHVEDLQTKVSRPPAAAAGASGSGGRVIPNCFLFTFHVVYVKVLHWK